MEAGYGGSNLPPAPILLEIVYMNQKLVHRVANKYVQWMTNQARDQIDIARYEISTCLRRAASRMGHLNKWGTLFHKGRRIQKSGGKRFEGLDNSQTLNRIASQSLQQLGIDIIQSTTNAMESFKILTNNNKVSPLSLQEAINEINIINDSWSEVAFRNNTLSVLISNVTLSDEYEDVDLGDFWIHLNIHDPLGKLSIEPVTQIESKGGYYHPHVNSGGSLCAGEGGSPMIDALIQGRLEDYFRIVEAILRTYNAEGPYEPLIAWYNPDRDGQFFCSICEEWRDDDESNYCEGCESIWCNDHDIGLRECVKCNKYRCEYCGKTCEDCGEFLCDRCSTNCTSCNNIVCPECLIECECGNSYCSSCMETCSNCGNHRCPDCLEECGNCKEDNCSDCSSGKCADCDTTLCEQCSSYCSDCGATICSGCRNECCEGCGRGLCSSCHKQTDGCLLVNTLKE